MSEEYLKSIIDCVSGIECKHETQQIAKYELIEHIEELRKENQSLKDRIEKIDEYIEGRISALTVSVDNKEKDQYFNNKCIGGVQELKYIRHLLKGDK